MSLEQRVKATLARLMLAPQLVRSKRRLIESQRKLSGKPHVVSAFLQIDDPYSYLLSRYLPELAEHFDVQLKCYLSLALADEYRPQAVLAAEYAAVDCARLAAELGIPFLDKGELPPTEHRNGLSNALAALSGNEDFAAHIRQALEVFWRGDAAAAAVLASSGGSREETGEVIEASQRRLRKLGHYSSAMLHYGGEWYWGVDRLHYLLERLQALGAAREAAPQLGAMRQVMQVNLPFKPPAAAKDLPPMELFFSFRSPYSYLGLQRIAAIADAFGLELVLRPVLPMVMRGLPVPPPKLRYIVSDTGREAERLGIRFGNFRDPLGAGVERCLAVFGYAESERRGREFALAATAAIWAQGTDLASDSGMRKLSEQSGLFWPEVARAMQNEDWREQVDLNQEALQEAGGWGVPTVRIGDFTAWGQDRDWMLVRHLEELCDTGDGILV